MSDKASVPGAAGPSWNLYLGWGRWVRWQAPAAQLESKEDVTLPAIQPAPQWLPVIRLHDEAQLNR